MDILPNSQSNYQQENPTKFISESFIKPKHEVEAANNPCYLNILEICGFNLDPIQKGLLYPLQISEISNKTQIISHLLEKLKQSLAITLVYFYPLAGRFSTQKYPNENSSLTFLDCTKGPGARLIHARALEYSLSDITLSIDVPSIVKSFFELGEKSVGFDGHTRALVTVQVTELQDGVFIGFTMNHSVGDGTSFLQFVKMLSEIFNSYEFIGDIAATATDTITSISRVPVFNYHKVWFDDNDCGDGDVAIVKLPYLDPEKFIQRDYDPGLFRERVFHFSAKSLRALKAKAHQECGAQNSISSFQSLIALVWRSVTRARNLSPEEQTSCSVMVNARTRFDPPISDDYFGNYLGHAKQVCNVKELLGHDLGWAAMILNKAIKAQDSTLVRDFYKNLSKQPFILSRDSVSDFHGTNNLTIGGSSRFDMYRVEFGLGQALVVRTGYSNKCDGKVTLTQGIQEGSVDLEICLKPHVMSAFESDLEFTTGLSLE